MKKKLLLAVMAAALSHQLSAQITVIDLGPSIQFGHISAIDFDADGDLDLVLGGESGGSTSVQMYTNNGNGTYTLKTSPLIPLARPSFEWADVNQDGILDLLTNGFGPFASLYTNDATGTLTVSPIMLPQTAPNSGFADFNNDGYVDIFIFGNDNVGKSKILFSDKLGGFIESNQFDSFSFVDPHISIVDFDNDKDLDMFITAGFENGANSRFSRLFVNNGSGIFTLAPPIAGLFPKGNGSSIWGDFNGDGFADLLLNGDGYLNSGEDADNYRLYRNNGNGTFTSIQAFGYRQNMTGGGGAFLDWDNDGDLDIVLTGWNGSRQATDVYLNNSGTFTAYADNASIPGSSEGSVEVGDANGDGRLDLFISGFSGNDWDGSATTAPYNRNIAVIALNPSNVNNTAPTAPTNLTVTGNAAQLNFTWTAATDATTPQNSLTYNFYLKDANNKWYYSPLSDITSGKTKAAKIGNVQFNKGWTVKDLPAGTYTWGVQAVDNSFAGSTFASGTFTISGLGTLPIKLGEYKAYADGNISVIRWQSLSEENADFYLVEKSLDGASFNTVAKIPAKGNSNSVQEYVAKDLNPQSGTNYYRLSNIDKDGKTQVFDVLPVRFSLQETAITVYPNPITSSTINIRVNGLKREQLTAQLFSMNGTLTASANIEVTAGAGDYLMQLGKKPATGVYVLKVSGSQLSQTLKVSVK